MNSNNDNESKNNIEDKLSSLSSSIQSGLKSLTSSSTTSPTPLMGDSSNSNTSSNKILGMDWKIFVLVIFIFGLLGINIFVYLAVGTQDVINAIKPITTAFSNLFHSIFKGNILNIFRNAIQGVYDLLFIAQGTIKGGVSAADTLTVQQTGNSNSNSNSSFNNVINSSNSPSPSTQSYKQPTSLPQTVASNGSIKNNGQSPTSQQISQQPTSLKNIPAQNVANSIPLANSLNNNALDKALNTALIQDTNGSMNMSNNTPNTFNYTADDSMSNIQQSKSNSKSGWCFIGEDRGFRSCIQVNANEKCMSGDIFPSQEICINPNLRQ
uniref:Uncharacterized protein n=1 Tax=viral metagenome TaxID=1070528 RepID=A0A6C0EFP9_9ZZZZ